MTEPCKHEQVVLPRGGKVHVCQDCSEPVQRVWVSGTQSVIDDEALVSIDLNARAYGWEIGQSREPLVPVEVTQTSPGNPFIDSEWRRRAGLE